MTRHTLSTIRRKLSSACLIGASVLVLSACASPEERMEDFTDSGKSLFDAGALKKAALEYRNALQIDDDHLPALRGLLDVMKAQKNAGQTRAILNKITQLDKTDAGARIEIARIFLIDGNMDGAVRNSDEAIALEPQNADALAISAAVKLRLEDPAAAVTLAEQAIEIDASTIDAYSVLAAERVRDEDYKGGIARLDSGLSANADDVSLRYIKIELLQRINDIDGAIEVFNRIIELQPDSAELRRNFAFFLTRNGRQPDARSAFEGLYNSDPQNDQNVIDYTRFIATVDGLEKAGAFVQPIVDAEPQRFTLRRFAAELLLTSGEVQPAIDAFGALSKSAGTQPEGLEAKVRQAELAYATGTRDMAEKWLSEVFAADNRLASALALRARFAIEDRNLDSAIADLRTILRDNPDSIPALGLLGNAHELAGATDLADERFGQAFRLSGGAQKPGLDYASFLGRIGKWERAEDILGVVLSRTPASVSAWQQLAQVRLRRSNWIGAQQAADRLAQLTGDDVLVNQIKGAALGGLNQQQESLDAFKRAHEAAPKNARPLVVLVQSYMAAGRVDEAESLLQSIADNNEDSSFPNVLLAQVYEFKGESEKAETLLLAARDMQMDSTLVHQSLYQFYNSKNRLDDAKAALDVGTKINPKNSALRLLTANYYERVEDFEAAIAQYDGLYQDSPNSPVIANNLASLLAEYRSDNESLNRALSIAERFRTSRVPHFRDTLGWAYYRLGDAVKAVEILEDVAKELPDLAIVRYHLGMGYKATGNAEGASKELQQALELIKGQSSTQEKLIRDALEGV